MSDELHDQISAIEDAVSRMPTDKCSVNGFLFQLPNVVVVDANLTGVWKNAPIFANDLAALNWK